MSNHPNQFKGTPLADAAVVEVVATMNSVMDTLRQANGADPYKGCVTGSMLISAGIHLLLALNTDPEALLDLVAQMIENNLNGSDEQLVAVPADIAATVKHTGEEPS